MNGLAIFRDVFIVVAVILIAIEIYNWVARFMESATHQGPMEDKGYKGHTKSKDKNKV